MSTELLILLLHRSSKLPRFRETDNIESKLQKTVKCVMIIANQQVDQSLINIETVVKAKIE